MLKILLYTKDLVSVLVVEAGDFVSTATQCGAIVKDLFDGYHDNNGKGVPCLEMA
jgi:hypothetical protein